ncbi:MAG: hypothetical protein HYS18_05925 [Burkholderiales bacterium]|nr:hypothetical protein [Burkholderiales bacterium]
MKSPVKQTGAALIESMIAVLILALGVLGTVGLQARAISALSDTQARIEATLAAEEMIGMMWNDQLNVANYATGGAAFANWSNKLVGSIPGATATVAVVTTLTPANINRQQVTVTITWRRKAAEALNSHTVVAFLEPA